MISDRRMKYLGSANEFDYYLFAPSFFRLYFENRQDDATHMRTLSHKIHMCIYLLWGGTAYFMPQRALK